MIQKIAEVLLGVLHLIDPKTRDLVRMRKCVNFGEKYILTNEEINNLREKAKFKELTKKESKRLKYKQNRIKYYRKWFFDYN